jgi:hypothetical protein
LPARIEFGFVIPDKSEGEITSHRAWAWYCGDRWNGVDLFEARENPERANYAFGHLSQDRVTFSQGKNLELTPAPAAGKVGFLIYPYVEVGDKPYRRMVNQFTFERFVNPPGEDDGPRLPGRE